MKIFVKIIKLIASISLCELAGIVGSIYTISSVKTWYPTLVKSPLNPPSWLFAPVWTTLFILMGIAFFIIWAKPLETTPGKTPAIVLFLVQLIFNTLWSYFFFGLKSPLLGLIDIVILLILIILTIVSFFKISKLSGWLMIPYLLWVSFASILNLSIYLLNR